MLSKTEYTITINVTTDIYMQVLRKNNNIYTDRLEKQVLECEKLEERKSNNAPIIQ